MQRVILAAAAALVLASCQTAPAPAPQLRSSHLGDLVYGAGTALADRVDPLVARNKVIIVATMVNVDDLDSSSTFGRLASQMILNRMSQKGFLMRDVTYTHGLEINKETGELVLSRDTRKLIETLGAQAVVAGTYAVAGQEIYLNVRLLGATDGAVRSSADVAIPLNANTAALVFDQGQQWDEHRKAVASYGR